MLKVWRCGELNGCGFIGYRDKYGPDVSGLECFEGEYSVRCTRTPYDIDNVQVVLNR